MMRHIKILLACGALCALSCTNNPYRPGESAQRIYFNSFSTPPSQLDPASAYYVHESHVIDQIYEPPFTYHYLKRPYEIIPLTAESVPVAEYYDATGNRLQDEDPPPESVARAEYVIRIRPGIMYQDHPCFAKDENGRPFYSTSNVTEQNIARYGGPADFPGKGTRELKAGDYALQVRRLADPRTDSPVLSTLAQYVLGLEELNKAYVDSLDRERERRKTAAGPGYNQEQDELENPISLDYMAFDFPGLVVLDDHTYKIVLKRKYPQILYWMCMHFFGPVPREALDFYDLPPLVKRQFNIDRCPVGTGPYSLTVYEPNKLMILDRNRNYHPDFYPAEGAPGDADKGLLADAGKPVPFVDRQVYRIERESIPHWHKFLQGYVDSSGIANDVFDQVVQSSPGRDQTLSDAMLKKGIRLVTDTDTTLYYMQFNMLDDVVGGYSPEKCKLRQAISIVLDYNQYLDIFANGRGIMAQGPIPPGIFGYRGGEAGTNPYVNDWDQAGNRHVRKSLETARQLMKEAGYPGGRGPDGQQLTLTYDHASGGDPSFRSYFDWLRSKFDLIGIRLKEDGTELSRFREKRRNGNWQISSSGWLADYPDPENFLFLFYGPNGIVKYGGVNNCNYESAEFDALFKQLETMANGTKRQELIDKAVNVLQRDCSSVWMHHPVSYVLLHEWYTNVKPHNMSMNTMRYCRIDPAMRTRLQAEWNRPVWWPIALVGAILVASAIPAVVGVIRKEKGR